jgi:2-dehydropantoate 2-reductase
MNSRQPEPEILIAGTGALACLFAARLAAAGEPVAMLGSWPEGLQALRRAGVRLVEADGRQQAYPVQVYDDLTACAGVRFALVLVKSWQTERLANQLADCLADDGLALTLQNGLGNAAILSRTLGLPRVALGVTTTGATLLGPGRVRAAGEGVISLEAHPRLEPLANRLRAANFELEVVADSQSLVWGKLVINAAVNPLTALLDIPNGQLLERPNARKLLGALAQETAVVAAAQGIRLPYDDPVTQVEQVVQRTSANISSMLQDTRRGALTEIEAINGAVVRVGERFGVSTPLNRSMLELVQAMVKPASSQ